MRGKYDFEDKEELYHWADYVLDQLNWLIIEEIDELDFSQCDISPLQLGKVLSLLGYEENNWEYDKEYSWAEYVDPINPTIRIGLSADSDLFKLTLYLIKDEE